MSKKIFLSLLFVLVLTVSCKNNTTDSTADSTITYQMFEEQILFADETAVISKEEGFLPTPVYASLILKAIIFGTELEPSYAYNDANTAITPNTLRNGLDKAFADILDSKINYEITIPTITKSGNQTFTLTLVFTPKNSNDKFDTASFKSDAPSHLTCTEQKVECNIDVNAYWAAN